MSEPDTVGFDRFFKVSSGGKGRHCWQRKLSEPSSCANRLIRIPTGFGKTLGVLATWMWHRVHNRSDTWPRRLVWCLPMRVLVEQTESEVRSALQRVGLLWDGEGAHDGKVGVHWLMGGADAGQWHLHPECDAVLIGTQDMLLSRAMNRGYASPRARWPMEFGLLNQDALWVMDEVQLMDVGLATSGQLQAFRGEDQGVGKALQPCFTWWMSATLQRSWLEKSPDTAGLTEDLSQNTHRIESEDRVGHLWDDVTKRLEVVRFSDAKALARDVSRRHIDRGCGKEGPTVVVLNTVERAVEVWKTLRADRALKRQDTDIRLTHSRFRPHERKPWSSDFLNRDACAPGTNRIIVSTQVVEAGVDISAPLLVTELAPWPSLVQRFGRCARWGGAGEVVVADFEHKTEGKAAPYSKDELDAARDACKALPDVGGRSEDDLADSTAAHDVCEALRDVGPMHLERFEEENEALLPRLYPYEPKHLLLRHELDELFDTSPDLSGADIDISRFIRSGDERDVQVFWAEVANKESPPSSLKPARDELCSVPFLKARDWLCEPKKSERLKPGVRAWVWDWLDREWRPARRRDIYPGQTLLVESRVGGYDKHHGWDAKSKPPVEPVQIPAVTDYVTHPCWKRDGDGWLPSERRVRALPPEDLADDAEDDESLSVTGGWQTSAGHADGQGSEGLGEPGVTDGWQTIASHGLAVGEEVKRIAAEVAPSEAQLLHLAGRWHDLGKAHAAFQGCIQADDRPGRDDIAKAPDRAWPCSPNNMYRIDVTDQRRGFRHELASTLGLFGLLQRHEPQHPALLGPWREWLEAIGDAATDEPWERGHHARPAHSSACGEDIAAPTAIEREILNLGADEFDLLAYLVCAHHGKVRMAWHASPADQKADDRRLRIRGVREDDILPPLPLADAAGKFHQLPATALDLSPSEAGLSPRTGRSWTERALNLVERFGPFTLAWLEALLRAADQRVSKKVITDTLLQEQENNDAGQSLDKNHRTLAQPAGGGASTTPPGVDPPSRRQLHGDGGRAGGRGVDSGTTRPPHSATRYVETSVGILSYRELAPLLAERVADAEFAISGRKFAHQPIHDLLLDLHRHICADLIPDMAGRWRLRDVRVGEHQAPSHWQVPILMRNYAADLEARMASLDEDPGERLIDDLAFAEGRLLHIHPFEDFNGRVSRLFLVELLYRLNLPVIDPAASSEQETKRYFSALQAYDRRDPRPLAAIWRRRLTQGSS